MFIECRNSSGGNNVGGTGRRNRRGSLSRTRSPLLLLLLVLSATFGGTTAADIWTCGAARATSTGSKCAPAYLFKRGDLGTVGSTVASLHSSLVFS